MTKLVIIWGMTANIENILTRVGSREEIAAECGVDPIAVYRWGKNGSIPSKHLSGVLRVANRNKSSVTAETLCAAHDRSQRSFNSWSPADASASEAD